MNGLIATSGMKRAGKRPASRDVAATGGSGGVPRRGGFALVVTVTLLVLLAVVAVGLLSLSTIALRAGGRKEAMARAEANARLALLQALGELQCHAGPDRVVTAPAGVLSGEVAEPHWTGVWSNEEGGGEEGEDPVWLVSTRDPASRPQPTGEVTGARFEFADGVADAGPVGVPLVAVHSRAGGPRPGRFGWWVADEGAKARIDVAAPDGPTDSADERWVRSQAPQEAGIHELGGGWEELGGGGGEPSVDRSRLLTIDTAALAAGEGMLARRWLHDLTTGGYGLPVNVREGGMKADLSTIFDVSNPRRQQAMFGQYFGAEPAAAALGPAQVYQFEPPADPAARGKFFLVDALHRDGTLAVGPNWGNLFNFAQLHENIGTTPGRCPMIGFQPDPFIDLRAGRWPPYRTHSFDIFHDRQHLNSGVVPVLSLLQVGFRLKTRPAPAPAGQSGRFYQVQLEIKPVVGLWNPHDVALPAAAYNLDWAIYPYIRLGLTGPGFEYHPRVWLRKLWLTNYSYPESSQNNWFQLRTGNVDFQPGEFRLFSITEPAKIERINMLEPAWGRDGAFTLDLAYTHFEGTPAGQAGRPMIVPAGTRVWIGDLYIEDSQHPETARYFGRRFAPESTASWCTLKAPPYWTLSRYAGLWMSGASREGWSVPEQLESEFEQTGVTAPKYSVEHLAATNEHMGTWALKLRTSREAKRSDREVAASGQTLRGWADTNPRCIAANPFWDGSRADGGIFDGWWFLSHLIGGDHEGRHSDFGPGGRGMVAWGSAVGNEAPQIEFGNGRFQGFGGPNNTPDGGQTHVALFAVPRNPLVSLGQFQHAAVARYNYEPAHAIGNSYASLRLPLDRTTADDFNGIDGFRMVDLSYHLNERLWDRYFFSTLAAAHLGKSREAFAMDEFAHGRRPLPNPRMRLIPQPGDTSILGVLGKVTDRPAEAVAARLGIKGAFNVNSTSPTAWKAVLASFSGFELPVIEPVTARLRWVKGEHPRLAKLSFPLTDNGYAAGTNPCTPPFWCGYRALEEEELDALAAAIVEQVRERGPFRSFAAFVNRDPDSKNPDHQRKGALQAAIDEALNSNLPAAAGEPAEGPTGPRLVRLNVIDPDYPENQAAGNPGHLMQADLLQSLGPILAPRSDCFRIRAVGEALDPTGTRVIARAVCEATVQRVADFLDPADPPHLSAAELTSPLNQRFGRRFRLTSFRWLTPEEV